MLQTFCDAALLFVFDERWCPTFIFISLSGASSFIPNTCFAFSHTSGTTLLALPAEIYSFGATYWLLSLTMIPIILLTAHVYLPVFYNLQVTSTYEYLAMRFDNTVRNLASFLFTMSRLLFLPIVIYIPALACSSGEHHWIFYVPFLSEC